MLILRVLFLTMFLGLPVHRGFAGNLLCKDVFVSGYRHVLTSRYPIKVILTEIAEKVQMEEGEVLGVFISAFDTHSLAETQLLTEKIQSSPEAYNALVEFFIFYRIYNKNLRAGSDSVDAFLAFFDLVGSHGNTIKLLAARAGLQQQLLLTQLNDSFVLSIVHYLDSASPPIRDVMMLKRNFFAALDNVGMAWIDLKFIRESIQIDLNYLRSILNPNNDLRVLIDRYEQVYDLVDNYYWGVILYVNALEAKTSLVTPADFRRSQIDELDIRNKLYDEFMVRKTKVIEAVWGH